MKQKWRVGIGVIFFSITVFLTFYFIKKQNTNAENQLPSSQEELIQAVDTEITSEHFKGSLLLIKDQKIIYKQAYGSANQEKQIKNKVDTSYPIASLQKILTGIVILQLIQEGKLEEDTLLEEFYPEIENSETITIRELLNHISGIVVPEIEPPVLLRTEAEQIENALATLDISYKKDFYYSNGNYTLLAGIISQVLKSDYQKVIEKRIIQTLELRNTYFWDSLPKNVITPSAYLYSGEDYQEDPFTNSDKLFSSLLGAGNMFMSVEDMWQVQKGLIDGQLFSDTEYNELANSQAGDYQAGFVYFNQLKYSEGNLGGYDTVIYGTDDNQNLVILFGNQPAQNGMGNLAEQLYEWLISY